MAIESPTARRWQAPVYAISLVAGVALVVVWAVALNRASLRLSDGTVAVWAGLGYVALALAGIVAPGAPWHGQRRGLARRRLPAAQGRLRPSGDDRFPATLFAVGAATTLSLLAVAGAAIFDAVNGGGGADSAAQSAPTGTGTGTGTGTSARASFRPNGLWHVVDTITTGDSTGASFDFTVDLHQSGLSLGSAPGSELSVSGWTDEHVVVAGFTQGAQHGQFVWQVQPDGSLAGSFRINGGGASGTSAATRVD